MNIETLKASVIKFIPGRRANVSKSRPCGCGRMISANKTACLACFNAAEAEAAQAKLEEFNALVAVGEPVAAAETKPTKRVRKPRVKAAADTATVTPKRTRKPKEPAACRGVQYIPLI